ncbi:MAG: glycerol-3-phosphate 1-O-acyltransferase PlsY [Hyphomicrobiales bacterium]
MAAPVSLELPMLVLAVAFLVGYLFGSIPFGLILTRLAGLGDVRAIGSGNIGATNVLRTGNKAIAAATLLGDMLKGTAPVLLAAAQGGEIAALVAGLGAFLGHLFPVWLKFKGGKGVATYIGVLLGVYWPMALVFAAIWLASAFITRYSSLSALIASAVMPVVEIVVGNWHHALLFAVLTAMLWWKHGENIKRLLAGTESRIGSKG